MRSPVPSSLHRCLSLRAGVVGDHRVRRVEDRLRAAVVLVEHDRGDVVERLLELSDVAHVGAAEPVHVWSVSPTMVIWRWSAASSRAISFCAMFVSWYSSMRMCWKRCWYCASTSGCCAEQLDGLHQQVVEVHRPGLVQARLVLDVDVGVLALEELAALADGLLGRDQLVLPQADLRRARARGGKRLASR